MLVPMKFSKDNYEAEDSLNRFLRGGHFLCNY